MSLTSAEITLTVDPLTAAAYQEASEEEREQAHSQARSAFELSLAERREQARKKAGEELIQVMNEMSRTAEARGLTPEILEQILSEDPSTDEA